MLDGKYLLDKKFSCILSILSIHSFYSKNIVDSFFFYSWFLLEADHFQKWCCSVSNYSSKIHSASSSQLCHSLNYNCIMRPAATRHTLKPFEAAIWAAVQPSLSAWLMRSAGTTGLDVPSWRSSSWSKSKMANPGSSRNLFPWAGALWYIRSLRLSTLPVSTAAWIGVQPSWK